MQVHIFRFDIIYFYNFKFFNVFNASSKVVRFQSLAQNCFRLGASVGGVCPDPGYPPGGYSYAASLEEDGLVHYLCQRPGYRPRDIYPILCSEVNGQLKWNSTDVKVTHKCIGQSCSCTLTEFTCISLDC